MSSLDKKSIKHLAELARLELTEKEEEKFSQELQKILDYFTELQKVNIENIAPMSGGTEIKNAYRVDEKTRDKTKETANVVDAFPNQQENYLKVPPVFS